MNAEARLQAALRLLASNPKMTLGEASVRTECEMSELEAHVAKHGRRVPALPADDSARNDEPAVAAKRGPRRRRLVVAAARPPEACDVVVAALRNVNNALDLAIAAQKGAR